MIKNTIASKVLVDDKAVEIDPKKCHGSWIVDVNGKEYLDCFSQFGSQALGWNHPNLLAAKDRLGEVALHKLANPEVLTKEYAEFVEEFSKATPDFRHHFYVEGGSAGVENALKAAFDWKFQKFDHTNDECPSDRCLSVIAFKDAFHGRGGYTLSLTNNRYSDLKVKRFPKFGWHHIKNPAINLYDNDYDLDFAESATLANVRLTCEERKIAAIIIEPIQGEGGDNHFRPSFFQSLRSICDDTNTILILDEVQTGLGMTGKMWAYEHFGIVPDLISFGKKVQVCGCLSTHRIDEEKDNVFSTHSRINSTWGGNIVDMVRSTVILKTIEEDKLVANAESVGAYLLSCLSSLKNARGRGLMVAFDLDSTQERDQVLEKLRQEMFVLPCGAKGIRFRPHLTFTTQEADIVKDMVMRAIA
jgi:L-lysine 6-transaminase